MLYYRTPIPNIVVASTILQCLGAGCPIVGNVSRYTELLGKQIFKYSNTKELFEAIRHVFDQNGDYKEVMQTAEEYVKKTSATEIVKQFIDLYKKL